jgi:hypothetical protein
VTQSEVLYSILIKYDIPVKQVRLIKMCLNETYSKVCIGRMLPCAFPIQNDLEQGDVLLPLLFKFDVEFSINMVTEN